MSNYDILFVNVTGSNNLDSKDMIQFKRKNDGIFYNNPLNGDSIYSSSTQINGKINFTLNDIINEYSNQGIFDKNNINVVKDLRAILGISSGGKRKSRKCRKTRRRRKTRKCRKTRRRY